MGSAKRPVYPDGRRIYRPSAVHRPSYAQQIRRYPAYRAQDRFQPSEVGYRPKRPSSQPEPQPPSSASSFMQGTGSKPSQPLVADQPDKPQTNSPADSYMPMSNSEPSDGSDISPPGMYVGEVQETSPKVPAMDQTAPPSESSEDSYFPSPPKYPHHHGDLHDYVYVDYDPTLHEHKPHEHHHMYYDNSYYHAPQLNNTYQLPPENNTYQPMQSMEENRNKKPYTYYYIGRKLWYIPLYFSVYFIVYITSLLVKSIARHKIRFPASYWAGGYARALGNELNKKRLEMITGYITKALEKFGKRYE